MQAAHRLSIPVPTIGNWMKVYKSGKLANIGQSYRPLSEIEMELARTRQEATEDITEYIEIFYRRQRLQPGLGFLPPAVFEQRYYARFLAA